MALFATVSGEIGSVAPPLVLLHGFGGGGFVWDTVVAALSQASPLLVYDLPGHGLSIDAEPVGGAGRMARAVLADLDERGIASCHLAGHSLGGATAALMALKAPGRVLSATLFAPGGFGPAIHRDLLARYSQPVDRADLHQALAAMAGSRHEWPPEIVDRLWVERQRSGARAALRNVFEAMIRPDADGGFSQGVLPLAELGRLSLPVKVIWGSEDRVLPAPDVLPGSMLYHRWSGCGHMLVDEAPLAVAELLRRVVKGR